MDLPIEHYKENGSDDHQHLPLPPNMRSEWEPCIPHQSHLGLDPELGTTPPPPPPPPSKRRFRSSHSNRKSECNDDRAANKFRETLMDRQVCTQLVVIYVSV